MGATLLGEWLAPRQFVGMATIFLGLATVDGRLPTAVSRLATRRVVADRLAAEAG